MCFQPKPLSVLAKPAAPPPPPPQNSSELSDSIESDHDVVNLDEVVEDEDDPLARLSDLDISLTLNQSVLRK